MPSLLPDEKAGERASLLAVHILEFIKILTEVTMFDEQVSRYCTNLDALRDYIDTLGPVLHQKLATTAQHYAPSIGKYLLAGMLVDRKSVPELVADEESAKNVETLRQRILRISPEEVKRLVQADSLPPVKVTNEGTLELDPTKIPLAHLQEVNEALEKSGAQSRLLYESSLITLVTIVEWLIAQVLRIYYDKFPGAAGATDKFYSLDDLGTFASISDARSALIEYRVEQQMRLALEDWLKAFREKLKLSMGYLDDVRDELVEIFKRRNLFVHNGGVVNATYVSGVAAQLRKDVKIGDRLKVTPQYLHSSVNICEQSFTLIAAELWKQLEPANEERASTLSRIAYQHLRAERWKIAERFGFFIMHDKKISEAVRLVGQINYWQSLKWSGGYEKIRADIEAVDFSAKGERFQLAKYALTDDYSAFFALLPRALAQGDLKKEELLEWPLFRAVRDRPEFEPYRAPKDVEEQPKELPPPGGPKELPPPGGGVVQ